MRTRLRRLLVSVACALAACALLWPSGSFAAQAPNWEPLGPDEAGVVSYVYVPSSDVRYTATISYLYRSDDRGASWSKHPQPGRQRGPIVVAVDPADHNVLAMNGEGGLYRADDGVTWRRVLETDGLFTHVVQSPANRDLYYAEAGTTLLTEPDARGETLIRGRIRHTYVSHDRGETWKEQETNEVGVGPGVCVRVSSMFAPHPSQAGRLYRASRCSQFERPLVEVSDDYGATWTGQTLPEELSIDLLAGGRGAMPNHLYLAGRRPEDVGGSAVFVSKDNGATWATSLSFVGGGTNDDTEAEQTRIWGMVSHPTDSNRVWLGIHRGRDTAPGPMTIARNDVGRIMTTTDGGETWTDAAHLADLPLILDLAISPDGTTLYAATQGGVFRLRLS